MAGQDFEELAAIVAFLLLIWACGRVAADIFRLNASIGYIFAGIAAGPNGWQFAPYLTSGEDGTALNNVWVAIGNLGVALVLFEAGMHLNFSVMRKLGLQSTITAVIGKVATIGFAMGLVIAYGFDAYPDAFSAGVAAAPTSAAVAVTLLEESKVLNSSFGQVILMASFLDDLVAILLFLVLLNTADGNFNAQIILWPLLQGIALLAGGVTLGYYAFPRGLQCVLGRFTNPRKSVIHYVLMLAVLVIYSYVGSLIGSYVLGAFVAGISFSQVHRSSLVWRENMSLINEWFLKIFFAASIGFSIPISEMANLTSFWRGVVFAIVAATFGKCFSGVLLGPERWVVGFAMVPRGEFAYLIAKEAAGTVVESDPEGAKRKLLPDDVYAIVVWGLFLSVIIAPFVFKRVLETHLRRIKQAPSRLLYHGDYSPYDNNDDGDDDDNYTQDGDAKDKEHKYRHHNSHKLHKTQSRRRHVPLYSNAFNLVIENIDHVDVLHELIMEFRTMELKVIEANMKTDGDTDFGVFTLRTNTGEPMSDEKVRELEKTVRDVVDDPRAQVVFIPFKKDALTVMEVEITMRHDHKLIGRIYDTLKDLGLEVIQATLEEHQSTDRDSRDIEVLLCKKHDQTQISESLTREAKKRLQTVLQGQERAEIFARRVSEQESRRILPGTAMIPNREQHVMLKITTSGHHKSGLLQLLTDKLWNLGMDVAGCEIVGDMNGQDDYATFWATYRKGVEHGDVWIHKKKVQASLASALQEMDPTISVSVEVLPDRGGEQHRLMRKRAQSKSRHSPLAQRRASLNENETMVLVDEEPFGAIPAPEVGAGAPTNVVLGTIPVVATKHVFKSGISPAFRECVQSQTHESVEDSPVSPHYVPPAGTWMMSYPKAPSEAVRLDQHARQDDQSDCHVISTV